jgi:hypothetical protein
VHAGYTNGENGHFEQIGTVEGVPDRLAIYQGCLLHSGMIPADMDFSPIRAADGSPPISSSEDIAHDPRHCSGLEPAGRGHRRRPAGQADLHQSGRHRLPLQFRAAQRQGISYRTGADPAIVRFKGAYYMFQTLADGYWRSTDLIDWTFVTPSRWPIQSDRRARGVVRWRARILIQPSMMEPESILSTTAIRRAAGSTSGCGACRTLPGAVRSGLEDTIKPGEIPPGPWDPALFKDDDGKWYIYWNSSNVFPLYAMEIEFQGGKLIYKGRPSRCWRCIPISMAGSGSARIIRRTARTAPRSNRSWRARG